MAFKGAIFDLDGVLVDTIPLHFASWKKLFAENYHVPFTYEIYQKHVDGKPRLDSIHALLPQLSKQEVMQAGELKQKYFLELVNSGMIKKSPKRPRRDIMRPATRWQCCILAFSLKGLRVGFCTMPVCVFVGAESLRMQMQLQN